MEEVGGSQPNIDKWPVVISFGSVHLFTVHLFELGFCEMVRHRLQDLSLVASLGNDKTDIEIGRDSESEHTVDVHADYFDVHKGIEEFLEAFGGGLVELGGFLGQVLFEDLAPLLVFLVFGHVVVERTRDVAVFAKDLLNFLRLWLVNNNAMGVVFLVGGAKVVQKIKCIRDNGFRETFLLSLIEILLGLADEEVDNLGLVSLSRIVSVNSSLLTDLNPLIIV